ncbi:hypothetical protein [Mycolicibacterium komossense]|uniref:Uncharacterized protein n=1 Tax=Mycolicibacterium komossense TaxID=1779 RepID=A0ABT3C4P1_9MYCO|nr:hypothetical protein [Mycolicibacterium komossense]MCV7224457.1 hypothetical protein [Mycolicibacterium komossense]
MADPEIEAMSALATALADLEDDARGRVLRWAAERYGVSLNVSSGSRHGGGAANGIGGGGEEVTDEEIAEEAPVYEHFADLFDKAQPKTNPDKALVAAYWLQTIQSQSTWQSAVLQKELKNLGHAISNITDALTANMQKKPARIVQVQKTGKSRQARKTYKVTHEGLVYVQGMLRGEGT